MPGPNTTTEGTGQDMGVPPLAEAIAVVVLQEMETYIYHHQNTVAEYITNRLTNDLCLAVERCPGQ